MNENEFLTGVSSLRSCTNSPDYIIVRDGVDSHSPILSRFCNTRLSVEIESSAENLFVELVADGHKESQGFAATFAFVTSLPLPSNANRDGMPDYSPLQQPSIHSDRMTFPGKSGKA